MNKHSVFVITLLLASAVVSRAQDFETRQLIREMNANRAKCQELTKQAEAKRADARTQYQSGQRAKARKSIDDAASLYGQIAELLNESADKGNKIVSVTATEWFKEYFTIYAKWTRNLSRLADAAREELLIRKNGVPSKEQLKTWSTNIDALSKENDVFINQIAKIESTHHMVPVDRD